MTALINHPTRVQAASGYRVTTEDEQLIGLAAEHFADDYRYLLDMVTTAGKAGRVSDRSTDVPQLLDSDDLGGQAG